MTVREMIERLEDQARIAGDDAEVRIAFQPSWPLRARCSGIVADAELVEPYDDDEDLERDPEPFVWVVASEGVGHDESPYAPRAAFEVV